MQKLLIICSGAMMAIIPSYFFKMLVLKPNLAPAEFIKKLYYAQSLKMLLTMSLLTIAYVNFSAYAYLLTTSFIVTYITGRIVTFYRYSNK